MRNQILRGGYCKPGSIKISAFLFDKNRSIQDILNPASPSVESDRFCRSGDETLPAEQNPGCMTFWVALLEICPSND
jgi:hypothetical protein